MPAALPTNFNPNHAPTAAEMGQILGALSKITNWAAYNSLINGTVSITASTSGTYVDIANFVLNFIKAGDGTQSNVFALLVCGWRTSVVPTSAKFAINFASTDRDLILHEITSAAGTHRNAIGWTIFTGVGAGNFNVRVRIKRNAGTGDMTVDATDTCSLLLVELPL